MINVLHGRQGVVPVACRSSRLVPPPLGCGAAQCTCAAGAALACPWGRGLPPPPKERHPVYPQRFNWFESTPRNAPRLPIQTNNHTN